MIIFFVKLFGQVLTDTDTSTHKLEDKSWRTISKIRLRLGFEDRNKAVYCHVANHISETPMEATARLRMKYTPRVSLTAEEKQVVEKGNVNLVCQVDSYPPAYMFAWWVSKQRIIDDFYSVWKSRRHLNGLEIPGEVGNSLVLEELTRWCFVFACQTVLTPDNDLEFFSLWVISNTNMMKF